MRKSAFFAVFVVAFVAVALSVPVEGQRGRGRGQIQLPEGPGQEIVSTTCVGCHNPGLVANATGYDQAGWRGLVSTMVDLPAGRMDTLTAYLAEHFPPRPGREPTLISGDVDISFQEWIVPTLGQRSRDPVEANGKIYWVGQFLSIVGELDPTTGEMREIQLDADARPHSITADADGDLWYMGNGNGTLGKVNAETWEVEQIVRMNDPNAVDPHTGVFNDDGVLFFTLQQSNMIGRFDPDSGNLRLITLPTENGRPYGIKVNSEGTLWFGYNGSNRIGRMDPETMEVTEFPTPWPETRIRRLALLSDDTIFYLDNGRGTLGRLDPDTGDIAEWPSPSGPESHPYAIEVIDDIVWYNESNQRPDALVRFDPATETFQSWAIPSGYGIIRHMRKTEDGNLLIHQSMSNRIGLVTIQAVSTSN